MIELSYELSSGELQIIVLDAVLAEIHSSTALVTEHPIVDGSTINDHVRANPRIFQAQIFVTNSPIGIPSGKLGSVRSVDIGDGIGATALQFDEVFDRVSEVHQKLTKLLAEGKKFRILAGVEDYENMVLEEVTTPIEARDSTTFQVTLRQVLIVDSKTVKARKTKPRSGRGAKKTNAGAQAVKEVADEVKFKTDTMVDTLFGWSATLQGLKK